MCKIREPISSKNNLLVTRLSKLLQKKHREEERLFLADGEKLFCEAVEFSADIEYVIVESEYFFAKKDFIIGVLSDEKYADTEVVVLDKTIFEKITSEKSPQGIISVIKTIDFFEKYAKVYNNEKFFENSRFTVMLCDIRDPGNMGAILRSACAFEIDALYVTDGCVDLFSPKTLRASMGALFKAPIKTAGEQIAQIRSLRRVGVKVYAAALKREAYSLDRLKLDKNESVCFVIGNEGSGLTDEVINECDGCVFIPMSQNTESLNASVASSILMWELFKTKRK